MPARLPFTCRVPIYGGTLRLFTTRADFVTWCQSIGQPAAAETPCAGRSFSTADKLGAITYTIAWLDGRLTTLSHETNHTALRILKRAGMAPTDSDGEALCHLQAELMMLCGADEYDRPLTQLRA